MGKSAPKPPDPRATSEEQSRLNKEAAYDSARLNQFNQIGPWGSTFYRGEVGSPERTQYSYLDPQDQKRVGLQRGLANALFGMLGQYGQANLPFGQTAGKGGGGATGGGANDGGANGGVGNSGYPLSTAMSMSPPPIMKKKVPETEPETESKEELWAGRRRKAKEMNEKNLREGRGGRG